MNTTENETLAHILRASRLARSEGYGVLSTGERLAVALVLNRADWLEAMDYTMAEAIERLAGPWLANIPKAASIMRDEAEQ